MGVVSRKNHDLDGPGGPQNSEEVNGSKRRDILSWDKQVGAIKSTVIPVNLLGKKVRLLTAVVKGDIPCC